MSKPVHLCQYDLPSGRLCRQIALKQESACRHHMRLFRHAEAETMHIEAMERLQTKLAALELPDLLRALRYKLSRLHSAVRPDPETRLTLDVTLERLAAVEAMAQAIEKWPENITESMS